MVRHPADDRRWAVIRVQAGESVAAVVAPLQRSRRRVDTWQGRARSGDITWPQDRSHRPARLLRGTLGRFALNEDALVPAIALLGGVAADVLIQG